MGSGVVMFEACISIESKLSVGTLSAVAPV
jgi:hypothetical protein